MLYEFYLYRYLKNNCSLSDIGITWASTEWTHQYSAMECREGLESFSKRYFENKDLAICKITKINLSRIRSIEQTINQHTGFVTRDLYILWKYRHSWYFYYVFEMFIKSGRGIYFLCLLYYILIFLDILIFKFNFETNNNKLLLYTGINLFYLLGFQNILHIYITHFHFRFINYVLSEAPNLVYSFSNKSKE